MTASPFNSVGGFSVGIPEVSVVDANGNVVTNVLTSGNVSANVFYSGSYKYANGNPLIGGANTQVQYNNGSILGGSANLTFNSSTNTLTTVNVVTTNLNITGNTVSENFQLGSGDNIFKTETVYTSATTGSVTETLFEVSTDGVAGVDAHIIATSNDSRQIVKLQSVVLGNSAVVTESFNSDIGDTLGTYTMTVVLGNVVLSVNTLTSDEISYKYLITVYPNKV